MEYEVNYKYKGMSDCHFVTFDRDDLTQEDISYSITKSLASHLGSNDFQITTCRRIR